MEEVNRCYIIKMLYKIKFLLFTAEAANHFFNGLRFIEKWACIIIQFSLQLTDTLKGGQL